MNQGIRIAGTALVASALVGAASLPSAGKQAAPRSSPTPAPRSTPTPRPVNAPTAAMGATAYPTLAPANTASNVPYPAYGTPVPGVDYGTAVPGIPTAINLDQSVAIAVARSPLLAAARADVGLARANVQLQQTQLLPNVAGTVTATRTHRQGGSGAGASTTTTTGGTFLNSGAGGSVDATNVSLAATLRQLIFDGGRVRAQIQAATLNETVQANLYKRQLQTVAFNVATAYYNALAARRTTAVDIEIVRLDVVQENLVTAQVRAGTAARTDIATAQLPTAQARVAVVRSQGTELTALASFANAMGLEANTRVLPVDDSANFQSVLSTQLSIPPYQTAIARAYALRPDLAAQAATVASAQASLRAARLGNFPTLSGNASAATASTDTGAGAFRNNSSIGVTLTIPFFDQGITRAQTAQAQASLDLANANLETTRQTVQLNVKQALVNVVTARSALDQTQAEYAKAVEVLRATQAQYRAGVTTLPLLLNAQVGVTQALTDQVTAVYTLRQAQQALLFATGANA